MIFEKLRRVVPEFFIFVGFDSDRFQLFLNHVIYHIEISW